MVGGWIWEGKVGVIELRWRSGLRSWRDLKRSDLEIDGQISAFVVDLAVFR
jgi:hypothetical protein